MIAKVSPRFVTSQAARTRLRVYSVALRQQPGGEHFTGFRTEVAIFNDSSGSPFHEIMNLAGWKRSDTTLPYIMLKEVVNLASVAAELADPCFDAGKGYKRFDALTGFFQISFF